MKGKYRMAHRLSFELHHGKIAEGLECCHRCDVPACVNPNHLFIGTHTDNMRDCEIKGRNPHRKGEKHHKAKLTDETVRLIASELKNRTATQWEIAKKFGVTQSTVSLIKLGKIWTHIA